MRWTSTLIKKLTQESSSADRVRVQFYALVGLPSPVERYLRRTEVRGTRWLDFRARHVVAPLTPGFVWDARVSIVPLLHVRVQDSYLGGTGSGRVSLLSVIPIMTASGGMELNSGALHRYLAEAAWYPTALLPTTALSWSPIDSTRALASLTDAGQTVSLEFRFNEAGEITGIYSPGRWGMFESKYQQVPWEGHFSNYERRDGMLVPSGRGGLVRRWAVAEGVDRQRCRVNLRVRAVIQSS